MRGKIRCCELLGGPGIADGDLAPSLEFPRRSNELGGSSLR
jgi:hypothetical protein